MSESEPDLADHYVAIRERQAKYGKKAVEFFTAGVSYFVAGIAAHNTFICTVSVASAIYGLYSADNWDRTMSMGDTLVKEMIRSVTGEPLSMPHEL